MAKTKLTVTLSPELVAMLDERVGANGAESRSAALESVLQEVRYAEAVRKLEEETAAYYRSMTEEEKREELEWAELAGRAAAETWREDDADAALPGEGRDTLRVVPR